MSLSQISIINELTIISGHVFPESRSSKDVAGLGEGKKGQALAVEVQ